MSYFVVDPAIIREARRYNCYIMFLCASNSTQNLKANNCRLITLWKATKEEEKLYEENS
jgi:hypothetical protein